MCHVVPATLTLAAPATITYLGISTLSFSQANMVDLLAMLDRGQIGTIDMAYSIYFKSNEKENCQRLAHELTGREVPGFRRLGSLENLALGTDGRAEILGRISGQFPVVCLDREHDDVFRPALFAFHREWLNSLFTEAKK